MTKRVSDPFRQGIRITFESFYNQVLILGSRPFSDARKVSRRIRASLTAIQSAMSSDIQIRAMRLGKR